MPRMPCAICGHDPCTCGIGTPKPRMVSLDQWRAAMLSKGITRPVNAAPRFRRRQIVALIGRLRWWLGGKVAGVDLDDLRDW